MDRQRHDAVHVVPVTAERRMRSHPHRQIEVARGAAANAGVPLSRYADALALGHARRDLHVDRVRPRLLADTSAAVARPRPLLTRSAARRAAAREHHVPADGADRAAALTEMAGS